MPTTSKKDKKIIERAKKQFQVIVTHESEQREEMRDDRAFFLGDQWEKGIRKQREEGDFVRPTLTINRTKQFINYIANQQRQNKPSIKVTPRDDGAQEIHAKNRQGLIKHILNDSKASLAFQKMFEDALIEGRGHCIINTDWVSDRSHDQKIVIDSIKHPRDVYLDIGKTKADYSDCKWGFHLDRLSREEYKENHPNFPVADWTGAETQATWIAEKEVIIAQYWLLEEKDDTLITYSANVEGQEVTATNLLSDLDKDPRKDPMFEIVAQRKTKRKTWMWYLMNADHILDRRELVCKDIPIVTTIGVEDMIENKPVIKGEVRDLKDSGRMYNFYASQESEIIGQSPKSPYVVAVGQLKGLESIWANANNTPVGFLPYHPVVNGSTPVPPPQRVPPPSVPIAYVQARVDIIEDMKAISGLQQANFGGRSNETSGVAIRERKAEGDTSNYHLPDNFTSALSHCGTVVNQMLPTYYTTDSIVSIMGEEDEVTTKKMGQKEKGVEFSLGTGEYGVISEVGPSFATQRQEAAANMIDTAKYVPIIGQAAPDLIIKAMGWPMKDKIAERSKNFLKATIPSMNLEDNDEQDREAILENQLQQQAQQGQQMQQMIQQLQQQIQKYDEQKMQMQQAKIDDDVQNTLLKEEEMKINQQFKQAELQLEELKITVDAQKTDLVEDTKKEIAMLNHGSMLQGKELDSKLLSFKSKDKKDD